MDGVTESLMSSVESEADEITETATRDFEYPLVESLSHTWEVSRDNRVRKTDDDAENESEVRNDPKKGEIKMLG